MLETTLLFCIGIVFILSAVTVLMLENAIEVLKEHTPEIYRTYLGFMHQKWFDILLPISSSYLAYLIVFNKFIDEHLPVEVNRLLLQTKYAIFTTSTAILVLLFFLTF